jgi:DNA repair protein RadA/Sms
MEVRIREAARMGFTRCVLPRTQLRGGAKVEGIELVRVDHLRGLLERLF